MSCSRISSSLTFVASTTKAKLLRLHEQRAALNRPQLLWFARRTALLRDSLNASAKLSSSATVANENSIRSVSSNVEPLFQSA
jgi:hypothetical protein